MKRPVPKLFAGSALTTTTSSVGASAVPTVWLRWPRAAVSSFSLVDVFDSASPAPQLFLLEEIGFIHTDVSAGNCLAALDLNAKMADFWAGNLT